MANYRRDRINDAMLQEVAIILRDIKDPRVRDNFISVTGVDVTPDLKFAKIYYSALYGEEKEIIKGLQSSSGYIRKRLAQSINLRITPELTFVKDRSIAHGAHISSLLNNIEYSDDTNTDEKNDTKEDSDNDK